ncbi:unnamed protein product, partial [Iphiclides podalirius]
MGSQWPGMGAELLRIPIFASAIKRCHTVLEPLGVDVYKILCKTNGNVFDNIFNSFIGITAVQIGLTDVMKAFGISSVYIVGKRTF